MTANASTVGVQTLVVRVPQPARRWLLLVPIICLALFVRWLYVPDVAYRGDLAHFTRWVRLISQYGVFRFYDDRLRMGTWDRTYPPLATLIFDGVGAVYGAAPHPLVALRDQDYVLLLKLIPVASEVAIIAAAYAWLINRPVLRGLIPALLAVSPGLIATTAWWGQYDAPFTLFLVLALIALNRDRPVWAWVFLAVATLLKQPAAILTPLLFVITLRRYDWNATLTGMLVGATILAVVLTPFVLKEGKSALSPYLKAGDAFPYVSNNAYNFWFALATFAKGAPMVFQEKRFRDALNFLGPVSYKEAGLLLFAVAALIVLVMAWRAAHERKELVWAALLYLAFFLFPTQVHERYLYPAAVLALFAVAQDSRVWWLALGLAATYSYNVLAVIIPNKWPGQRFAVNVLALPTACLNLLLFLLALRMEWVSETNTVEGQGRYDRQPSLEQV
ncbi:MAG: DUF2029 domain-containing protein [Chloroflexi bacterium]|nr:DUF2029 domain-containing protein [Chloroflexota bacterium]